MSTPHCICHGSEVPLGAHKLVKLSGKAEVLESDAVVETFPENTGDGWVVVHV